MGGADDDENSDEKVLRVDFSQGREAPPPAQDADPEAQRKRAAFEGMIDKGMVMVTLDARAEGVEVPAHHEGDLQLGLNFSHRFYIDDFTWSDADVRATLSFQGQPSLTIVPWSSVWMLRSHVTGEAFVFPESAPEELADAIADLRAQMERSEIAVAPVEAADEPASVEPASVEPASVEPATDDPADDVATPDDDGGDDEPPPDRPRLRLVKS